MDNTRKAQNKLKVFFRRVSTTSQDLIMQESADEMYRSQYSANEILIMTENGVSAKKLDMNKRPQMKKLVSLVMKNQVEIIYAFDRTRLFRDFYESNFFVSLCKTHNVSIVYTSPGNGQQATDSTIFEGVLNIVSDIEGENIARRVQEARLRYPPKKLGFIKDKETRTYSKDPEKEKSLLSYFEQIKQISNETELERNLTVYKKKLGTSKERLLKLIQDPFYAAYDISNGEHPLSHVEPYLSFDEFKEIQAGTCSAVIESYLEMEKSLKKLNTYDIRCGLCNVPMTYRYDILRKKSWYMCSRKHTKILIETETLSISVEQTLKKMFESLNTEPLIRDSRNFFKAYKQFTSQELGLLEREKKALLERIILETEDLNKWKESTEYNRLIQIEQKHQHHLIQLEKVREQAEENKELVNLLRDYLSTCKLNSTDFLASLLIKNIRAYPDELNIEVSKFDYLTEMKYEFILMGDQLL